MEQIYEILQTIRPEFDFKSSENFVNDGYLDSFDIVSLISVLEENYSILIDALDILPENFTTAQSIADLVKKSGGTL